MASPKLIGGKICLLVIVMPSCSISRDPASSKQPNRERYSAFKVVGLYLEHINVLLSYKHGNHSMVMEIVVQMQMNLVTVSVEKMTRTC